MTPYAVFSLLVLFFSVLFLLCLLLCLLHNVQEEKLQTPRNNVSPKCTSEYVVQCVQIGLVGRGGTKPWSQRVASGRVAGEERLSTALKTTAGYTVTVTRKQKRCQSLPGLFMVKGSMAIELRVGLKDRWEDDFRYRSRDRRGVVYVRVRRSSKRRGSHQRRAVVAI